MPTLTTSYVYFGASGAHTRQPRAVTSYGGFTPIPGLNPGGTATLTPGTPFQPGPANPTEPLGPQTLNFAFVNVSGCTEGPLNSFVAATPPPVGTVGTDPINVLYVYVPQGGPGNGGDPGAVIDAFNESSGSLVDNSFVTVSPDPGGALTTEANQEGWVDTASSGYTIKADHPNIGAYSGWPTSPLFDQWVDLTDPNPPTSLINGADLKPAKGQTVYALAFYKNPAPGKLSYEKAPVKDTFDTGLKYVVEKGGKELVENVNPGDLGDPALLVQELKGIQAKLTKIEAEVQQRGKAFIKNVDRPAVGTSAKKRR